MSQLEDILYQLISEQYGSVPKFAKHVGIPTQTIYSALHGSIVGSSATTFLPIANGLHLDPFQLAVGNLVTVDEGKAVPVPLFGSIAAGEPIDPEYADTTYPIPLQVHQSHPHAFLLRVDGESMNRVLPNGCYALVDPCSDVDVSNDVYAIIVGETAATVKRVRLLENGLELIPSSDDPTFRPIVYDFADPDTPKITVVGRVVWYGMPASWRPTGAAL